MMSSFEDYLVKHPTAALLCDLIQIHNDFYIVKAELRINDRPQVSALGIDKNLYHAQSEAQRKALAFVGVELQLPVAPPLSSSSKSSEKSDRAAKAKAFVQQFPETDFEFDDPNYSPAPLPRALAPKPPTASPAPPLPGSGQSGVLPKIEQFLDKLGWTPEVETCALQNLFGVAKIARATLAVSEQFAFIEYLKECDAVQTHLAQLNWGPKFVPKCLEREFGKSELFFLSVAEMHAFSEYLANVIEIGTEITRLGWAQEFAVSYLETNYGVKSRGNLTAEQAIQFLTFLHNQPT